MEQGIRKDLGIGPLRALLPGWVLEGPRKVPGKISEGTRKLPDKFSKTSVKHPENASSVRFEGPASDRTRNIPGSFAETFRSPVPVLGQDKAINRFFAFSALCDSRKRPVT